MTSDSMSIIVFISSTTHMQQAGPTAFILSLLAFLVSVVFLLWLLYQRRQYQRRQQARLQEAYDEQEILVQQQQLLLSEVDRLYREQAQAAVTDAITGLPNYRAVMNKLDEVVAHCQQTHDSCAVLFVDLDHFKNINDIWGHRAGDAILREVATRLRSASRLEDFVGRYGGEEFAVVLTRTDISEASRVAERLRLAVAEPPCFWETEDTQTVVPISITASIGLAVYQLHGVTREVLIRSADLAMYRAKQNGRNRVYIAEVEDASAQETQAAFESEHIVEVSTVKALAAAASAHDRGTVVHSYRMMRLAEATARLLGRPEQELQLIRLAALLHDIGKIGIPDAILHKPGPLTDEEWAIMRRHPQISYEILQQAGGVFYHLAHIVVAHHERWDGHGYPAGLAQEAIPLSARIISVVDSYDAMTSRRVYRAALTAEQARAELLRCAGSQHDPLVVAAFLRMLDEQEQEQELLTKEDKAEVTSA